MIHSVEQESYAGFPSDEFHPWAAWHHWMRDNSPGEPWRASGPPIDPTKQKVVIVGGGHAGLYAAMLLLKQKVPPANITILEASDRVGGRVWTHTFPMRPGETHPQYSDMGAMRLPDTTSKSHQIVFDFIAYLQKRESLKKIPYVYSDKNNRVSLNGMLWKTVSEVKKDPKLLGFPSEDTWNAATNRHEWAGVYFDAALYEFTSIKDPQARFERIVSYDNWSFRRYLSEKLGWSPGKINYVQTVLSASGQFDKALPEVVFESVDFDVKNTWWTIEGGLGKITGACVGLLSRDNIVVKTGHRATKVENTSATEVTVHYVYKKNSRDTPDKVTANKVILAIPFAPLRMMDTPNTWPVAKKAAIRDLSYEALYKCAIPFKTRWWMPLGIQGGQSQTDLAAWWQVYSSDPFQATMLIYAWATDSDMLATLDKAKRTEQITKAIAALHPDVTKEQAAYWDDAIDVFWSHTWAGGNAHFLPGQFRSWYNIATRPEGNCYFAGEHLSLHHGWISGAYESALVAVRQALNNDTIAPLRPAGYEPEPHTYDYSGVANALVLPAPRDEDTAGDTAPPVTVRAD